MGRRDKSRDGFGNKLQTFALTHFKGLWRVAESIGPLRRKINKKLVNSAIYKIPTRPYALSTLSPYSSWESLTNKSWTGRHLPPDTQFNREGNLPPVEDVAVLFRKKNGETIYSEKSTLLFPYWVQWFTDGFLRTDHTNRFKNTSNHHIDLSPVYGLNKETTDKLRSLQDGKLKSQQINGEEYPCYLYEDPDNNKFKAEFEGLYVPLKRVRDAVPGAMKAKFFAMGVERANVQIGYVMFNVLCLREHNRLCGLLSKEYRDAWKKEGETDTQWKAAHPEWNGDIERYLDERIFQTARNIVILLIMKIVVEEYINHITPYHFNFFVDPPAFSKESWYRENWMTQEFNLVYRWHSALPETFTYDGQEMPMIGSLWNNELLTSRGLGGLFEESSSQPATKIGFFNTPDFLIEQAEIPAIQLGRQTQLASYNTYREMCGFPRVTAFEQITGDEHAQAELKRLYGDVDKIEFFVGLFAEDVRENSALPGLIGRLVGIDAFSQAFTNPLLAENIFNEQTFSPLGFDVIQKTNTLSEILNRNTPQDKKYKVTFYRNA